MWAGGRLQVWVDLESSGHYQSCIQTAPGDKRLTLPPHGFFGVTASTGSYGDAHVVYSLTLASLEEEHGIVTHVADAAAAAAVPKKHQVHLEGRHHESHVRVAAHPAQLGGCRNCRAAKQRVRLRREQRAARAECSSSERSTP